tara:strand:+ start:1260 stop:1994 length:735 start_codon:yes stop_codon:yes gene_type:complete
MLKTLAIVPARIGSKGVPKKNLINIGNFSLVERALFTAIKTKSIQKILVSTDSENIKNLVNKYGDYAPFLRPKKLSTDKAKSLDVIKHSLLWAEKNYNEEYNYIALIEPPCPFRLPAHIDIAIDIIIEKKATSVVSLIEVGDFHPIRMKKILPNGMLKGVMEDEPDGLRRQDQSPVYIRNSAVYVFDKKTILRDKLWGSQPHGFIMDKNLYYINIDEPIDLEYARLFYNKMKKKNQLDLIESII